MSVLALLVVLPLLLPQDAGRVGTAVDAARQKLDEVLARDPPALRPAADAWRDLARALVAARRAAEAVEAFRAQLALREQLAEGPADAVDCAACRIELGNALRAAERYREALDVLAAVPDQGRLAGPGADPKRVALLRVGWLTAVAQVEVLTGDNAQARPRLEEALAVATEALGADAPNTQVVRQSLATVFALTGEPERARALAEQALAAAERSNGPDHLKTAHAAFVLGQFELQAGRPREAVQTLERALRLRRAGLGPRHPDTLVAHFAHVQALTLVGDKEQTCRELHGLLATAREVLGAEHYQVVDVEVQLAELLAELGHAEAGLSLAQHGVEVRLRKVEERPGPVVSARLTLARVLHALERGGEAIAELERAQQIDDGSDPQLTRQLEQRLAQFLPAVGREQDAIAHARTNLVAFPGLLARQLPVMRDDERVALVQQRRQDLDLVLNWSLSAAEVTAAFRDCLRWKAQVARGLFAQRAWLARNLDAATVAQLEALRAVLAQLAAAEQRRDDAAVLRLRAERARLQDSLPAASDAAAAAAEPAAIQARLRPGEALVDFHVYERLDRKGEMLGAHLLAFVLVAGREAVQRVDFGAVDAIAAAVQAHVRIVARRTQSLDPASRAAAGLAAARVAALLWRPLSGTIGDAARVFVCADGPVALLPMGVLPGSEPDTFLVERCEFVSLISPHDLLRQAAVASGTPKALLVGDVDYGPGGGASPFRPLPATAAEVAAVAAELTRTGTTVKVLRGVEAARDAVQAGVVGARFVHLATHGEFARGLQQPGGLRSGAPLPGQGGGIALALANTNGAFTTAEVAWLDLHACELAVLSACDTGLGEAATGEHLLGLRRALRFAGARVTVTSVWQVDDAATGDLMAGFYARLGGGAPAGQALRAAQLAQLARNRAAGDSRPGAWGAFVVEGN